MNPTGVQMKNIKSDVEIKIPIEIAVCPDCKQQITIYPDGWEEEPDGWVCSSFTTSCATEPDIEEKEFDEWRYGHPSFDMPYIYWLPITEKITKWLKKEYRFDL